jgi:hypothetical protein
LAHNPQNELDKKKEPKFQWLQNSNQMNGKNLKILLMRCETSRYFRNKETEHLKGKMNEFETYLNNKNNSELYREIKQYVKDLPT